MRRTAPLFVAVIALAALAAAALWVWPRVEPALAYNRRLAAANAAISSDAERRAEGLAFLSRTTSKGKPQLLNSPRAAMVLAANLWRASDDAIRDVDAAFGSIPQWKNFVNAYPASAVRLWRVRLADEGVESDGMTELIAVRSVLPWAERRDASALLTMLYEGGSPAVRALTLPLALEYLGESAADLLTKAENDPDHDVAIRAHQLLQYLRQGPSDQPDPTQAAPPTGR